MWQSLISLLPGSPQFRLLKLFWSRREAWNMLTVFINFIANRPRRRKMHEKANKKQNSEFCGLWTDFESHICRNKEKLSSNSNRPIKVEWTLCSNSSGGNSMRWSRFLPKHFSAPFSPRNGNKIRTWNVLTRSTRADEAHHIIKKGLLCFNTLERSNTEKVVAFY